MTEEKVRAIRSDPSLLQLFSSELDRDSVLLPIYPHKVEITLPYTTTGRYVKSVDTREFRLLAETAYGRIVYDLSFGHSANICVYCSDERDAILFKMRFG